MYFMVNSLQSTSNYKEQEQLDYISAAKCQKDIWVNVSKIMLCVMIDQVLEEILAIPVESS